MQTFQFWTDTHYESYADKDQQFLNSEFNKTPRPAVVQLSGGISTSWLSAGYREAIYELRGFDGIESGNAEQINLSTGSRRHVLLKPVYRLGGYTAPPAEGLRFLYLDKDWCEYSWSVQQQIRAAAQCSPRPAQFCFEVNGYSYWLKGLDRLDDAGGGQLEQVNSYTGKVRPVTALTENSTVCKVQLGICRAGTFEAGHPVAQRALVDALCATGPRAISVPLPSGDLVENFSALEVGAAGVRCIASGEWIPVHLCLSGGNLPVPARGCLVVPDELETTDTTILSCGGFYALPESSEREEKVCAICLGDLEPDDEGDIDMDAAVFRLQCGHLFHAPCLDEWFKSKPRCPQCQHNFGILIGNGPRVGNMKWHVEQFQLPGHPESSGSIVIEFDFPAGVDESGSRYAGRSEQGYLPGNAQGRLLLELFKIAMRRRVMFGLGNSMTTGRYRPTYSVHIKTSKGGGAAKHGYPDPQYFQRAFEELRNAGVSVADLLKK